jgi:antitoxin VapB
VLVTEKWRTKTFKSGNSVALRLPKSTGFVEGDEVVIVPHRSGRFSLWKEANSHEVLMSLYGSMSPGFMKHGRGDIEQEDRSWDRRDARSAA